MSAILCTKASAQTASVARPTRAVAFKPTIKAAPVKVSTGKASSMQVWKPINNKQFETFSYLPPLTAQQISKQVDYFVNNNWTPCLEFAAEPGGAYVDVLSTARFGPVASGYYDNRYWTMWKLPMFGCNDGSQVLKEVAACTKAFPEAYIRLVAFDANRQVQIAGFLVHRPANSPEYSPIDKRQTAA